MFGFFAVSTCKPKVNYYNIDTIDISLFKNLHYCFLPNGMKWNISQLTTVEVKYAELKLIAYVPSVVALDSFFGD